MRTIPENIWNVWNTGGPAIGANGAANGYVTVEEDWFLNAVSSPGSSGGGRNLDGFPYLCASDGTLVYVVQYEGIPPFDDGLTVYDPGTDSWTELATPPSEVLEDRYYQMVYNSTLHQLVVVGCRLGTYTYDIDTDTWLSPGTGYPEGTTTYLAAAYRASDQLIYTAGGYTNTGNDDATYSYDPVGDVWTPLGAMPRGMAEVNGEIIGNKFYVFGGWDENVFDYIFTGFVWDLRSNIWTELTSLPSNDGIAGWPLVVKESSTTLIVTGGWGNSKNSATYRYTPAGDLWTTLADNPQNAYLVGDIANSRVYTFGNSFNGSYGVTVFYTGTWHTNVFPWGSTAPVPTTGGWTKGTIRWWQRADNSQVETVVPNIESIDLDRSIDQDAATAKITLSNQWHLTNGQIALNDGELGQMGYFSFSRGESADAVSRWGHTVNDWNEVLVPDALIRTYEGYGGRGKSLDQALTDGNVVLTGVWLVDSVRIGTGGKVEIACRDMAKLLIEQQIYPPFVPSSRYPVQFSRWGFQDYGYPNQRLFVTAPALFGDPQGSALLGGATTNYNGVVPQPDYPDYAGNTPGLGYWAFVNNGSVYGFGNNTALGGTSTNFSTNPVVDIENSATGNGYWLLLQDGTVLAKGDAPYYGNGPAGSVAMARNRKGDGYWIIDIHGTVYTRGAAPFLGDIFIASPAFGSGEIAVSLAGDPNHDGYYIFTNKGYVHNFGTYTQFFGQPAGATWPANGLVIATHTKIVCHPDGGGYWTIDQVGDVHAYGKSLYYGQLAGQAYAAIGGNLPFQNPDFPDYMSDLVPTPSGKGYWLVGVSGGIYPFGDAIFLGGLNSGFEATLRIDGNYTDYVDIVKELVLRAGFWLFEDLGASAQPRVFGNLETTGAFASDKLDESIFDKQPVISPITKFKEIVGYQVWVDEDGAFHFESPNIFEKGNFDENGVHTSFIPDIDETKQITSYTVEYSDKSARSEIIISTNDPTEALTDTLTTTYTPSTADLLRGLVKPAMWTNGVFTNQREQEIMAELIGLYIWLSMRQGSLEMMANPAIQINDQVRIWERVTSETYIHYVRGISSHMDLNSGEYMMTLTTHWMGDNSVWAVDLGRVPFSFGQGYTTRPLTYSFASNDPNGTLPDDLTTDGNLATQWTVSGMNNQTVGDAVEYIEYTAGSQSVNRISLYPTGIRSTLGTAYVSVRVGGVWQGAGTVPYLPIRSPGQYSGSLAAAIPYVTSHSITSDTPVTITLPASYNAERIRITISGFADGDWGPFSYSAGLKEVEAGHV